MSVVRWSGVHGNKSEKESVDDGGDEMCGDKR